MCLRNHSGRCQINRWAMSQSCLVLENAFIVPFAIIRSSQDSFLVIASDQRERGNLIEKNCLTSLFMRLLRRFTPRNDTESSNSGIKPSDELTIVSGKGFPESKIHIYLETQKWPRQRQFS
jgi:hypothetical protein